MQTQNRFTIKIQEKVFTSNEDGFLNLNEIHNGMNLKNSKRPSQWRSQVSAYLFENANLHTEEIKHLDSNLASKCIYGDEKATIAYAMWIDVDFYLEVVEAFIDLRNGRVSEALERTVNSMSKSDGDKLKGIVWENINGMKAINQRTALQVAGINNPIIFMRELRKRNTAYRRLIDEEKIVLQTYAPNKWIERFTQEGFQWLLDKSEEMNSCVSKVRVKNKV